MLRRLFFILFLLIGMNFVFSAEKVLDVSFKEYISEFVSYNPLKTGGGIWYDQFENQKNYSLYGEIIIKNIAKNETLYSVLINLSDFSRIYNLTQISGFNSYINQTNNSLSIFIPELVVNMNSKFRYDINNTKISPPINFLTNYSNSKILTGRNLTVYDTIKNEMNNATYTNSCVYNISVVENSKSVTDANGTILNFTFLPPSLSGTDSSNVLFLNDQKFVWDVNNGNCLNFSKSKDINYLVYVPDISVQKNYEFISSVISYNYNSTISKLKLKKSSAVLNIDELLKKSFEGNFTNNSAVWNIYSKISNPSNISVNLKSVTLWVSTRNGGGSGFTNPAIIDNDTISNQTLLKKYTLNSTLNSSINFWDNNPFIWRFNYTLESSPIVWMNFDNEILDDGFQFGNRKVSFTNNKIYTKEIYVATGYWLELTKDITRVGNNTYQIDILLRNIGPKQTPSNQVVVVYSFIPKDFTLVSSMFISNSSWYTTDITNKVLIDPNYNGTMYQFALLSNNIYNSSLDRWAGSTNLNNSWTLSYNVTGIGKFNIGDLFLAGVDPLHVESNSASEILSVNTNYSFGADTWNSILVTFVIFLGVLTYVF